MAEAPQIHGTLLARNTLLNLLGQVIPLLIGLATIPYIVRGLGTERFGGSRDRLGGQARKAFFDSSRSQVCDSPEFGHTVAKRIRLSPFFKDVAFTSVTSFLTVLCLLATTRILAQGLGPEKFGAYSLARKILSTTAPFSLLAMDVAVARYMALSNQPESRAAYLLGGLVLGVVPSLVVLTLGWVLQTDFTQLFFRDPTYVTLFGATLLMIVGYSTYGVLYAFYRGSGQMTKANLWQLGPTVLGPLIVAAFLASTGQVALIVLLSAVLYATAGFPLAYNALKALRLRVGLDRIMGGVRELAKYGIPRVPGGLAFAGLLAVGPFLACYFGSLRDAGYLVAGQAILRVVESTLTAFGLVALPKVTQLFAEGRKEFLSERIVDLVTLIFFFGLFSTLHLLVWADEIIYVLLGPGYEAAIPLVRISLIALLPYLTYVVLRAVVDAVEEKAVNTVNLLFSLAVTVIISIILARMGLGVVGLAIGTATGFAVLGFLTLLFMWKRYPFGIGGLRLKLLLVVNTILVVSAILIRFGLILPARFSGPALVVSVAMTEGLLFAAYVLVLRHKGVRGVLEIERRIVGHE